MHQLVHVDLNSFHLVQFSDFVRGIGETPPVVDEEACRKLLRKSTAALCAHIGFDSMYMTVHLCTTCYLTSHKSIIKIAHEHFLKGYLSMYGNYAFLT